MKPWYEQSFGTDYMLVYKHRNWENAINEVRQMMNWLKLPQGAQVLDIGCGMGRHSLAMNNFGYSVTGIDLSPILLEEAVLQDVEQSVKWVQGDMRELPFEAASFDATFNLFTSFGYFTLLEDNVNVLRNIRRVLREDGAFIIDFLNPIYVKEHLVPCSEHRDVETGLHIQEVRSIQDGWVQKKITISDSAKHGECRQYLEQVRLLELGWFERHLAECDLTLEQLYGNYDCSAYDASSSPRMIMVGRAT